MFKIIVLALSLLGLFSLCGAQVLQNGQCDPDISVVQNFDAERYTGLWYLIESYPSQFQTGECNNANYTLNNGALDIFITQVVNQTLSTISQVATIASNDGSAKLIVSFPADTNRTTQTDYWILSTDYDTYSFAYSCTNIDADTRLVLSWKLSRTKQMPAAGTTAINNIINTVPILDQRYFETTDQSVEGCFYFPEPQSGVPVIFPGQCDESIAAVPNFNLERYTGLWNLIESYPSQFQTGECNNANYTLNNGALDIFITQVVNQTLSTISQVATIASNDGSARLIVRFPADTNRTTQTDYWILSTDYDTYSFAYSCTNIDANTKLVLSWKLSRTEQIPAAGTTAINNIINTIPVLDQRYFETTDRSEAGCFYFPEPQPGVPVVFRGQCDENIAAVPNFNLERYTGLWNLIESYPSQFQTGECNNANYTLNNGALDIFITQVVNQTLSTISQVATIASNDGSAKLIVRFPADTNRTTQTDYWILSTDYDTYSFAYSCTNIDANTKLVLSWKLSRTEQIPAAGTTAINNIINTIPVLDQRYFETTDRSEAGCFYFPEPQPGVPVVFRGQCDETIAAVPNFNLERYTGLWNLIESYPSQFQTGECNNANYTLNNGALDIFITQVVNQTLSTISQVATIASNDGSAKLIVRFPADTNRTTQTDYWILSTDYDTYSFAYSCTNIDANTKLVLSWKLSRTEQIPAAGTTAINNIINTIPVLDQRYFETTDRSEAGCFYFPEPQPGVPVVFRGQCDDTIAAVPNFNLERYTGLWNLIESYPSQFQTGECNNANYTLNNGALDIFITQVVNQTLSTISQVATIASNDGSARLIVRFPADTNRTTQTDYWILSTDYDTYSFAYSCTNIDANTKLVLSWKLSRTEQIPAAGTTAINNIINTIPVLDQRYFETTDRSEAGCFYFPEPQPGVPVVFRGQCDETIAAVPNFNLERYTGLWNLIESYPSQFQTGECNNANYTLNNGALDIFITQVVNQTLSTISQVATIASNDGSARLIVRFPADTNRTTQTDYWILSTDYDTYSFAYSCTNIDANTKLVLSWKLSRTEQIPAAGTTAINNIINTIPVLDQRYFETTDRSEAGCFYFPEPQPGVPVVFRGQCNETIAAVPNFNLERYTGLWYLIESYPSQFQTGECNNANYTLNNGALDIFITQVVNQTLRTINQVATIASNDGSAKLIVSFPADTNRTTQTDYWILSTDYDTYSFAYSCTNIDADSRLVIAWKLSRQQNLTATANTAINSVINTIPVLRQEYFEVTSHSDDDCFYYPDNNGGPVILDGQCPNVNEVDVVTNFNVQAFAGIWHEIARFPSELQSNECASSNLVVSNNNTYTLTKSSVSNELLITSIGSAVVSDDGRGLLATTLTGNGVAVNINLHILATDYTEYALAYSCTNLSNNTKQIYSWKLGRSRDGLSQAANNVINQIVSENVDLFEGYYENTDQSNDACFYYPKFDPLPDSIDLPGPCDERIRAKANFNVTAFLGRWFETARYPQRNQRGICNRAEYSSNNDTASLAVRNSQVLNGRLGTISGSASVVSTDGSAELEVILAVSRVASMYVLETDYTSFALLYSCRNLDNGNRRVASWKMSRERTLSAQASVIIDEIINNTQGLLQAYYRPTSQSDEDCFYIPQLDQNSAVLFRGQCEDITGVQGFDIQRYLGWWHEIERYSSDADVGVCISSQIQASGNQFQVVDTNVFDLTATVNTSTLTATTDGRLRRTLSNGQVVDTWVLATDYETYSLLYSCENVNDEYRRVWSAKHSKSRQLTQAAQNVMNATIQNNQVLVPELFIQVDQSDSACFHYPEPNGERVILPGQCDDSIPVVQNFDVGAYTGTWYQIERYPQIFERGTCTGARYTVNEATGVVTVLNWEVVDGVLRYREGNATVSSDDGSARLTVVLPSSSGGLSTSSLYVLTTDYVSYSLAYSCFNVNQFQRAVGAWKISRTRTMPAAGTAAINAVIAQRQELHQPYFLQTEQSEDCDEPSSSYLVTNSIIVMLVCGILHLFS